jgi:hypothetical protein
LNFRKGKQIKPEHLVVYFLSFKNSNSVNTVFSELLGNDFFKEVDAFYYLQELIKGEENRTRLDCLKNWRKYLDELYEIRNSIIHDKFKTKLKLSYILQIQHLAFALTEVLSQYFVENCKPAQFAVRFSMK